MPGHGFLEQLRLPVFDKPQQNLWPRPVVPFGAQLAAAMAMPAVPVGDPNSPDAHAARERYIAAEAERVKQFWAEQQRARAERDAQAGWR